MTGSYDPPDSRPARDLAYGGLFGAAALALPSLFHLLHLGHFLMPMYIPLMALPFFVGARVAGVVGLVIPMLSSVLTGMPPLFPPVAPVMAVEIGLMAGSLALLRRRYPAFPVVGHVVPVLLAGRVVNTVLLFAASAVLSLPAAFVAGISFISGWPGVLLMIAILPAVDRVRRSIESRRVS